MIRERLPDRRPSRTFGFQHEGVDHCCTVGFYPNGRIGEIFLSAGHKEGNPAHIAASDAAVAASLALQHGCDVNELIHSLQHYADEGGPAGALGKALRLAQGHVQGHDERVRPAGQPAAAATMPSLPTPAAAPAFEAESKPIGFVPSALLRREQARQEARLSGFTGDACGTCGNMTMVRNGTCLKCNTCGATTGCS